MVGSALSAQAVVDRLEVLSPEVRSSLVLDASGDVAAHAGEGDPEALGAAARDLLAAADTATARGGLERASALEVSSPLGGVFGVRAEEDGATLVAVSAAGALPALVLYDLRMALRGER